MTVSSTVVRSGPFTPDGVTTRFPFQFSALLPTEVEVFGEASGDITSSALYDVTLTSTGGAVVFLQAPTLGAENFYIGSNPSFEQTLSLSDNAPFDASDVEAAFDRAAIRDLTLADQASRTISAPLGEPGLIIPPLSERIGQIASYDANGDPSVTSGITNISGDGAIFDIVATAGQTAFPLGLTVQQSWLIDVFLGGAPLIPGLHYAINAQTLTLLVGAAAAGQHLQGVRKGGVSGDTSATFTAVGAPAGRTYGSIFAETVRLTDYIASTDGGDCYPAWQRIVAAFAGAAVKVKVPTGTFAFSQGLTDTPFGSLAIEGDGSTKTTLVFPPALLAWISFGANYPQVSMGGSLAGLTLQASSPAAVTAPPVGANGVVWGCFNYGRERDVRVRDRYVGRGFNVGGLTTSVDYDSERCATDNCTQNYEAFGNVAGAYVRRHVYGRNGGEGVDCADACTLYSGSVNDIHHDSCQILPNGPNAARPTLAHFSAIQGTTGIIVYNDCTAENFNFLAALDAGQTVTSLSFNGGRYAPVNANAFSYGDVNARFQYCTFGFSALGNTLNLVNPYRCTVGVDQLASATLIGGAGASCVFQADVSGQLTLSGAWDKLSVTGACNPINDGATGDLTIVVPGYVRFTELATASAGLPSGALWNNGGALAIVP